MKKIILTCLAFLLSISISHAATKGTPCNGFEVKIKNETPDDLVAVKIQLIGGQFQPDGILTISAHTQQAFLVNNTADNGKMKGIMEFQSVSIPAKRVILNFDLRNKHFICHHDNTYTASDYKINFFRSPGKVSYTVG